VGTARAGQDRQRRALRLIGGAFAALTALLTIQSVLVPVTGYRPGHSVLGIAWTALTALVMFASAAGKAWVPVVAGPLAAAAGSSSAGVSRMSTFTCTGLGPSSNPVHRRWRCR
jgi:hypothetical protein